MKKGFTLAEVLVTLGIIGVVAAMTLPGLIGHWREYVTIKKLEQAYSLLSQSYLKMVGADGDVRNLNANTKLEFMNLWSEHLEVISQPELYPQFKEEVSSLSRKTKLNTRNSVYRMVLKNGLIIYFIITTWSQSCNSVYANWNVDNLYKTICGTIFVDINGKTAPNSLGRDIFGFYYTQNRIVPMGADKEPYYSFMRLCNLGKADYWDGSYNGEYCTAWVLYNKNMDYLHCNDLSWKGKIRCKK